MLRRFLRKTSGHNAKIATDLQAELGRHHLSDAPITLIPQMIEQAALLPAEMMAAVRSPIRICTAMLAKLTDPAHQTHTVADAFARVVAPVLTLVLADTATNDTLRPAFEDAAAESFAYSGKQSKNTILSLKKERASLSCTNRPKHKLI